MKKVLSFKKYLITCIVFLSLLFVSFLLWPDESSHSQLPPPPPPPPPIPLVPSVLEDIRNTKHNLSSISPEGIERAVFTTQTTEICVFCHTPHGAIGDEEAAGIRAPLWNRRLSTARYILYDQIWSTSFEAYEVTPPKPNAPTGYSRLCLSCHDGTIALGTVLNPPGSGIPAGWIPTSPGTMPLGSGVTTGDTRVIGTNLQNDHPISFVYDTNLAMRDEELVDPGPALVPPAKVSDTTPISPLRRYPGAYLNKFDSVHCTSCHNPHAATYPKFLRTSYFNNDPADPNYPLASKIICLYCHDKPGWSGSSHDIATFKPPVNPSSANPYNYDGTHTVGQYACRACHDPHTAQGAKRLLREGVDLINNPAIENTCYQCHRPASEMAGYQGTPPPDIRSEFYKDVNLGTGGTGSAMNLTFAQGHEPLFVSRPQEGVELYSSTPPPFNEYTPGSTIQDTAHIECVDCHNPHQVSKTNRLKGMKGIDINGNVVGAKIPGNSREPYVFEVCLRCHGNSYTNLFLGNRYPDDTIYRSDPRDVAPMDSNLSYKGYSNKRKEFDPNTPDIATDHTQQSENPAFHPVAAAGRNGTPQLCQQLAVAFNLYDAQSNPGGDPSKNCDSDPANVLRQLTIQCTDCHNNNTTGIGDVRGPVTGLPDGSSYRRITDFPSRISESDSNSPDKPQGPHGSIYPRILRNRYQTDNRNPGRRYLDDGRNSSHAENFLLCFRCHDRRAFEYGYPGSSASTSSWTGFFGNPGSTNAWDLNLHMYHLWLSGAYCNECHYNVHSNIEATNTIYGDGTGRIYPDCGAGTLSNPYGCLPQDDEDGISDGVVDTHLINFAPGIVEGATAAKPRWFYDIFNYSGSTYALFRCDLRCHGVTMSTCHYRPSARLSNQRGNDPDSWWCAGGGQW